MALPKEIYPKALTDMFLFEVSLQNIAGWDNFRKFYNLPNADTTQRDLWSYGGTVADYVYTSNSGADYYVFSSSASDTQVVRLYCLDQNFEIVVKDIQLQGQTPIKFNSLTTGSFITTPKTTAFLCTRAYRPQNNNGTSFV